MNSGQARVAEASESSVGESRFMQVLFLPGVLGICSAYFFLKFLRYALLLWLPFYYREALGYSAETAGYVSTSFEFGGIIGTPFIGYVSDRFLHGRRDITSAVFMSGAAFAVAACNVFRDAGVVFNAVRGVMWCPGS